MNLETDRHCFSCEHYFGLTSKELEELKRLYGTYAHYIDGVKGVCLDTSIFPNQIIQRFICNPYSYCSNYNRGYSMEKLHLKCPSCHDGEICVRRPFINDYIVIMIGCSRYPYCSFATKQLVLNVTCRFCGSRLVLSSEGILRCTCQGCGRSVNLPVAFKTYPGLALPGGGCVHTEQDPNCVTCQTSRKERKSLLLLEMNAMFNSPRLYADLIVKPPVKRNKESKPPFKPRFYGTYYDDDENLYRSTDDRRGPYWEFSGTHDEDREDFKDDWWKLTDEDSDGNSFF